MAVASGVSSRGQRIWNFLKSAIGKGLNKTQTLQSLQDQGLGYRKSTFLKDYDLASDVEERASTMKFVPRSKTLTDKHYSVAKYPLAGGMRQTTFRITGYDTKLEEDVTRHVTIAHDTLMARRTLEVDAIGSAMGTSPTLEIAEVMPVGGMKFPLSHIA